MKPADRDEPAHTPAPHRATPPDVEQVHAHQRARPRSAATTGHGESNTLDKLDASLTGRLGGVISRLRAYVLIEGVAWTAAFLAAGLAVQGGIDYAVRGMRWSMRASCLALLTACVIRLAWRRVIAPARLRIGLAEAAHLVERLHPELASVLISAVRFSAGETGAREANSSSLMACVIDDALRRTHMMDFTAVVDPRRARSAACGLLALVLITTSAAIYAPQVMGLWFARNVLLNELPWPKRTTLIVELHDHRLVGARGDDLTVQAHAEGIQPREVEIRFNTASGKSGRESMVTVGGAGAYTYRYTFQNVQEEFDFHLRGGGDRTDTYRAVLLERPRVVETSMTIRPPEYTHQEDFTLGSDERAVKVLPGTEVTIEVTTNKPVVRATLMTGDDRVAEAYPGENDAAGSDRYAVTFSPMARRTFHFALLDATGLTNKRPKRFSIRLENDEPPRVRMNLPGVGEMITPEARLPIKLEFSDTYGLATAQLAYSIARTARAQAEALPAQGNADTTKPDRPSIDPPRELIPLPEFKPQTTSFRAELAWPVSDGPVAPGDQLRLSAAASDFDTVSGPHVTRSPEWILRVVTRDVLLLEMARREQEYRMDFGRLIDRQEQLRGDLLTVVRRHRGPHRRRGSLAAALGPLERRQRNIAGSVNVIRQQFEQIWAELQVNQLDSTDAQQRIERGIIAPLTELAKRDLIAAGDTIRRWSRDAAPATASEVDDLQVTCLARMREVLAFMIQWEGYNELVNMLRDIVRLQGELKRETEQTLIEEVDDVFED